MRIAVVSDTHLPRGRRVLPPACVERLQAADLLLHCGDVSTAAALADLEALGPPVLAVVGNVDEPALHEVLPVERIVPVEGARIGMVHVPGPVAGRAERLARRFPDCGAVVYGHTHLPEVTRHADVWVLNPGSPTERRRAPCPSMLELTVAGGELVPELVPLA